MLTMKAIATRALAILQDQLVFPALINKEYSGTFMKKGDTIQVKRPAVYVADEFGGTINLQDINPFPVLVTMNHHADVSVEWTSKEAAMELDDLEEDVLRPALVAIAEKVNNDGLDLYKWVGSYNGTAGTTPDGLEDIKDIRVTLNKAKAPMMDRYGVWNPDADGELSIVDAIVSAEKSGSTAALREGAIGKIQGINNYMTQAIKTHTAGLYTALADVTGTIVVANNAVDTLTGLTYSSVVLTSAAGASTATLLQGDLLTFADENGKTYKVTVIENTSAAVAGVVTAKVFPAVEVAVTANAVTFADVTSGGHVANLGFYKDAFGFVTAPLMQAEGADSAVVNYGGLSIRVVKAYDITTKETTMSLDFLYGYAPLYPELATRILG